MPQLTRRRFSNPSTPTKPRFWDAPDNSLTQTTQPMQRPLKDSLATTTPTAQTTNIEYGTPPGPPRPRLRLERLEHKRRTLQGDYPRRARAQRDPERRLRRRLAGCGRGVAH